MYEVETVHQLQTSCWSVFDSRSPFMLPQRARSRLPTSTAFVTYTWSLPARLIWRHAYHSVETPVSSATRHLSSPIDPDGSVPWT